MARSGSHAARHVVGNPAQRIIDETAPLEAEYKKSRLAENLPGGSAHLDTSSSYVACQCHSARVYPKRSLPFYRRMRDLDGSIILHG